MLHLEGCIVTIDALNRQREIARQIIDQKGGYAATLKVNQGTLHDDVRTFLDDPDTELSERQGGNLWASLYYVRSLLYRVGIQPSCRLLSAARLALP